MKRAPWCCAVFAAALLLPGCTTTMDLQASSPAPAFRKANRALGNGPVDITLTDGQLRHWKAVTIGPELTTGVPLDTTSSTRGAVAQAPELKTKFIAVLNSRSRRKGVLQGILWGAGIGAIMGAVTPPDALCSEGDTSASSCPQSKGESFTMLTMGGAVWGAIIGAIRVARTEIRIR